MEFELKLKWTKDEICVRVKLRLGLSNGIRVDSECNWDSGNWVKVKYGYEFRDIIRVEVK